MTRRDDQLISIYSKIFYKVGLSPSKKCALFASLKALFGFTDLLGHNYLLVNHLLLIFKYNADNSSVNNTLSFQSLKCVISQIKYIEETMSKNDVKGALSSLRQFLAIGSPLKMMKNAFYFTSKALFVLKIFKFLS